MNTFTASAPRAPALLGVYTREARYEFIRLLRTPSFALPTMIFPLMFYLLFGVLLHHGNPGASQYLMASYSAFGVMGPGLFGFGVSLALDRERGLLTLKRALPVPAGAPLVAKMVMAMVFAVCIGVLLILAGRLLGGVPLTLAQMGTLLLVDVLGVLPFCALGLLVGALVGGSGAPAVVNMIYLPMSLLSGLWLPLSMLPDFFGKLAPLWPAWHLGQLALGVMWQEAGGAVLVHVGVLAAFMAVCLALARRRLRRA